MTKFKVLFELGNLLKERLNLMPEGSYSSKLFNAGLTKILDKLGEEIAEFLVAVVHSDKKNIIHEAADTYFHLVVFIIYMNLDMKNSLPHQEEVDLEIADKDLSDSSWQIKLMSQVGHNYALLIYYSNKKRLMHLDIKELHINMRQLFINIILLSLTRNISSVKIFNQLKGRMKLKLTSVNHSKVMVH